MTSASQPRVRHRAGLVGVLLAVAITLSACDSEDANEPPDGANEVSGAFKPARCVRVEMSESATDREVGAFYEGLVIGAAEVTAGSTGNDDRSITIGFRDVASARAAHVTAGAMALGPESIVRARSYVACGTLNRP